ncbi:AraC family transcriptional regulator [Gammaproteobacteria bacterium]|nr:AraC family transcriptional regulator [Gammaproteobacteria bacterium]
MQPLPLVKLSTLRPVLAALRQRGINPEPLLTKATIGESAVMSDDADAHVMVINRFLEDAAMAAHEPTLGVSIGMGLGTGGWPILLLARDRAHSLGDFLALFISQANDVARSTQLYLTILGQQAVFGEMRNYTADFLLGQNDGVMMGLAYSQLQNALGKQMDPSRVLITVSDPELRSSSQGAVRFRRGDNRGFQIRFPSVWLAAPVNASAAESNISRLNTQIPRHNFLEGFRLLLDQSTGAGRLAASDAANLVEMSNCQLARRLARFGTSMSVEIVAAQMAFAKRRLRHFPIPINEIASALGYSDAANFSRAFRKHVGLPPSTYRQQCLAAMAGKTPEPCG